MSAYETWLKNSMNPKFPRRIGGYHWANRFILILCFAFVYFSISNAKDLAENDKPIIAHAASAVGQDSSVWALPALLCFLTIALTAKGIAMVKAYSPFAEMKIERDSLTGYGYEMGGLAKSDTGEHHPIDQSCHILLSRNGDKSKFYTIHLYIPSLRTRLKSVYLCAMPDLEKMVLYTANVLKQLNVNQTLRVEGIMKDSREDLDKICGAHALRYDFSAKDEHI